MTANGVETLDRLFLNSPHTIRYAIAESLYGCAEIAAFRAARSLQRISITTCGRDLATAWTLFYRPTMQSKIGRQRHVWMRTPEVWRMVAAHASIITAPQVCVLTYAHEARVAAGGRRIRGHDSLLQQTMQCEVVASAHRRG